MSIDPSKLTVDKLLKEVSKTNDLDSLKEILAAEKKGKKRKSALSGIQQQIDSIEASSSSGTSSTWYQSRYLYYLVSLLLVVWAISYFM